VDGGGDGTGLTGAEEKSAEGRDLERLGRGILVCGTGGGGGDGETSSTAIETADMRLAMVRLSLSKPVEKNEWKNGNKCEKNEESTLSECGYDSFVPRRSDRRGVYGH
jgi:hypothetical protein